MSRRTQCRAFWLASALVFAHAASPALRAAPFPGRPASGVARAVLPYHLDLPFVDRVLERLASLFPSTSPGESFQEKSGTVVLPPPPPPTSPVTPDAGPVIDPSGGR